MLVCDENSWKLESALTQIAAAGNGPFAASRHIQITAPGENVDDVGIYKSAIVISNVDHDALPALILYIQIDIELRQAAGTHVRQMNVAKLAAAHFFDIRAIRFDPLAVK